MSLYDSVRASVDKSGEFEQVSVNQRALIDKILARYASAGAVYRELLQNSNDANATEAEVHFTTSPERNIVTQVEYKNNGMPFRPQDWARLKKIAEGNPDESKIGAFGVGAYTMFSICEEPMILSGNQALAFVWKGDALWTKTVDTDKQRDTKWTTFVLPSRDPYTLPSLVEFGEFLCASLTFTKNLSEIRVFVNGKKRLTIVKTQIQEPTPVQIQTSSSWWKTDGALTESPQGLFSLKDENSLLESFYHIQVTLDSETAAVTARYLSATAKTKVPSSMVKRMERVMKKKPPSKVEVQIFLSGQEQFDGTSRKGKAYKILQSFSPRVGEGRIFIGFRTSQTTGLAAHLAAPFVPTVEREAMDLQDQTLRVFNLELLEFSGILMRLTLEHGMSALGVQYEKGAAERAKLDQELIKQEEEASKTEEEETSGKAETEEAEDDDASKASSSTSVWGFAKYMAKGVKKTIVKVKSKVEEIVDDGGELMNPRDPRPLCHEETQGIILMQSFCPRQSTPDPLVGTALAQGFSRCFADRAPPVLTRSGVVPGDQARLPNKGMEAFCKQGVIRSIVYQNAEEYHNVIAQCRVLDLNDLATALSESVLEEKQLIRLMNWWVRYTKIHTHISSYQGVDIKERIRFVLGKSKGDEPMNVLELKHYLFYLDKEKIRTGSGYSIEDLPMPDSILPKTIRDSVTVRTLNDQSLRVWFSPLPVEIWIDFIAEHQGINSGQPEDEQLCLRVLSTLSQEYSRRSVSEQRAFGSYCQSVLRQRRCIPFDSAIPTSFSADFPSNLYLYSAELKAFDGVGNFHKVSQHLKQMGITDDFLVSLGVRKSVAIDFLFAHLDTLQWSSDPKPLIEYLRSATLTKQDVNKLRSSQYLPAENDESRMFGPSELYLPNRELRIFPFVKLLQWPSEDDITERSLNGKFLTSLGVNLLPPLLEVLFYMAKESTDEAIRLKCLDFVAKRLGSGGDYASDWNRLSRSDKQKLKFLPGVAISPITGKERRTLFSTLTCCYNGKCAVMGIPVLDTSLGDKAKLYGTLFQCVAEPAPGALLQKLRMLVSEAKKLLVQSGGKDSKESSEQVVVSFSKIFGYLSGRTSDMSASMLGGLANEDFIPCIVDARVEWFKPNEVFFKSEDGEENITHSLFQVVEFSPFLAAAGVKQEAATKDIFRLMIESPETVLAAAKSEAKYKQFLRRVAAHKPFRRVTPEIRDSPFLLAYSMSKEESKEKATFELAKAQDVYIIDNSFFARMFPVKRAPHESDLEDFYSLIGSKYISKEVKKKYHIVGEARKNSSLTKDLVGRIQERGPLLVSPSVTSRPLVSNAASIIDEKKLDIVEVPELKAVFSLKQSTRSQKITCCSTQTKFGKNCLYVTKDFDWFDVGYAIGELILERCQLEDAFFISSLLEAPLEQLRARGFPVDRIIHPEPPPEPEPKPEPKPLPAVAQAATSNTATGPTGNQTGAPGGGGVSANGGAPTPPSRGEEKEDSSQGKKEVQGTLDDYVAVLKNIFPGVDEAYIRNRLGDKPTMEDVRDIAEEMTNNGYPKEMKQEVTKPKKEEPTNNGYPQENKQEVAKPKKEEPRKSKIFGSKKLGRAVNGLMGSGLAGMNTGMSNLGKQQQGVAAVPPPVFGRESNTVRQPEMDAAAHHNMEQQLAQRIKQSTNIDGDGFSSEDRLQDIPEGMDHDEKCELVPGHDLKPFVNPVTGKSEAHNGIKVFFAAEYEDSESFVRSHLDAVESFAVVLERLSDVYGIKLNSVAIYHDSVGNSIAFNANRALYFNLHFFCALHYGENGSQDSDCYSYWFVTFAHELAHHFVSAHNRAHAFYTESYCTTYMPKLLTMLSRA
mmetsp:Transcript_24134/g.59049  ORF Transcript_24134/g.59049 Transcript_24134/m.59049 type:complete len:1833 (-) Transcript_24134:1433-6931(-)